jgi:predicted CopG family antitoxin
MSRGSQDEQKGRWKTQGSGRFGAPAITVDEEVYEGLRKIIGPGKISKFVQELVRPHVVRPNLESAYAEMARDKRREKEAMEWAETSFKDIAHETG